MYAAIRQGKAKSGMAEELVVRVEEGDGNPDHDTLLWCRNFGRGQPGSWRSTIVAPFDRAAALTLGLVLETSPVVFDR